MRIVEITPLDKRKRKVLVDEDFAFALYRDELETYHIEEGGQLPPEVYREIEELLCERARNRALHILQSRDRTEAEMVRKLEEGCYPGPVISRVMDFLREYHYVDDMEYGRRYIELCGRNHNRRWLQASLARKGLSRDQIEQLLEEGEVSEEEQVRAYLSRKGFEAGKTSDREAAALLTALARRGYSWEIVRRIMKETGDFD